MATLIQQQKVLARLANKANLENIVSQAIRPNGGDKKDIIAMNQDQLSHGLNNEGNLIGRYAEATEAWARAAGTTVAPKHKDDAYNFEWTGDFFKAFKVRSVNGDGIFQITSGVSYINDIQQLGKRNRANGKIFGLSPENMKKFNTNVVLPQLLRAMKSEIAQERVF